MKRYQNSTIDELESHCDLTEEEIQQLRKKYPFYDTAERLKNITSVDWWMSEKGLTKEEAIAIIEYDKEADKETEEEKEKRRKQIERNKAKRANKSTSDANLKKAKEIIENNFVDKVFCNKEYHLACGGTWTIRQTPHQLKALEKVGFLEYVETKQNRKYYKIKVDNQ